MTNLSDENGKLRTQEHNARVRAFQILCALGAVVEAPLSQAEIETRFEDLFVLPQPHIMISDLRRIKSFCHSFSMIRFVGSLIPVVNERMKASLM